MLNFAFVVLSESQIQRTGGVELDIDAGFIAQ
jgi:hypothetical protein